MRKLCLALALVAACSMGIAASYAGPGCCASKKDGKGEMTAKAKAACASVSARCASKSECTGEFPQLVRMVGDKAVECPKTAERLAKEQNAKVVYMLGDRKFECEESAYGALADAAEEFNRNYARIVLVADGKAYACAEDCSKDKPCHPVVLAAVKTADDCCMTTGAAKCNSSCSSKVATAKATCSSSKGAGATCSSKKTELASSEGKGTCGSKKTELVSSEGKGTCGSKKTELVSSEGKGTCGSKKTELVTSEGKGTCGSKKTELVSSEGKGTCGSKKTELVSSEGKGTCGSKKTELVSSEGKGTCGSKKTALASGEGSGCSKSAKASLAKADSCCASKKAALVKADKNCMELVKSAKEVKFCVAGQQFTEYKDAVALHDRIVAASSKVSMKYVVDGKEVSCSSQICPKAREAGKVKYVVGKDEMGCEIMARIAVAKARFEAAKVAADEKMAKM